MSQGQTRGPGGAFSAQQLRSGRLLNLIAQKPELPENRNRRVPVSAPVATCSFSPLPCSSLFTFLPTLTINNQPGVGALPGQPSCHVEVQSNSQRAWAVFFVSLFWLFCRPACCLFLCGVRLFSFGARARMQQQLCPECSFPSSCLPPNPGRIGA